MYTITKWCAAITDGKQDKYTGLQVKFINHLTKLNCGICPPLYKFRLLDDDGIVYAYGLSDDDSSFAPLDKYEPLYGVTDIQFKNKNTGEYESL